MPDQWATENDAYIQSLAATCAGKAALSHAHPQSDVTGLVSLLALKADLTGGKVPVGQLPGPSSRNTVDQTTTLATAVSATGLVVPIAASEVLAVEFNLQIGCNNTGGVKIAVTIPSGATMRLVARGMGATAAAVNSAVITASGTLTTAVFNNANLATGWIEIRGVVANGANAGNVQLQFASATAGQTSTIFSNSYVVSTKI